MPRIQRFKPGSVGGVSVKRPPIRPAAFAAPGIALAEASEKINRAVQASATIIPGRREKEAERTLKALEFNRELNQSAGDFLETYQDRQDYENFEPDAEKYLEGVLTDYSTRIGDDKTLQVAFERKFNQKQAEVLNVVKAKKLSTMTERALGAFEVGFNEQLENYAGETDPTIREIIKQDIEIDTADLVAKGFMTQAQAEKEIQSFNDQAEQVRADKLIEADADMAEEELRAGSFDMDPKIVQRKIEKSIAKQKEAINQQITDENRAAAATKRKQEDRAVEWTVQFEETKTLDMAGLLEDLENHKISRSFFNAFTADVEKEREQAKSNQVDILEFEERIKQETEPEELEKLREDVLNSRTIISKDKGTLLDRLDSFNDRQFKITYDQAEDVLKSKIITTGPLQNFRPGEPERFETAKQELYQRLKNNEPVKEVMDDMIPRYDLRPSTLKSLPTPRYSSRPKSTQDIVDSKSSLLDKIMSGSININNEQDQASINRELELLEDYEDIYQRIEQDGR